MNSKFIASLVIVLLLVTVFNSVIFAKEQVTIWWPHSDREKAVLEGAIKDFNKEYSDIEIITEWQPETDFQDKFQISFIGGTAPDILRMDHVFVQTFGYKGMLVDLRKFGANDLKDKYFEGAWNANLYQDKVFALPFDANTISLMYNKELLAETNTKVPTNFEELIEVAKANTRDTDGDGNIDIWGYTVPVDPASSGWLQFQFLSWLWRNGGEILNEDWTEAVFNSEESVEALQMLHDVVYKHKLVPQGAYYETEFYKDSVALMDMGCWAMNQIEEKDKPYSYAVLPSFKPEVGTVSGLGLYSLAITTTAENPEAAYKFVKFLSSNKKYQLAWTKETYLLPSLKDGFNDPHFQTEEWQVFKKQMENVKTRTGTPAWPEIEKNIGIAIQKVILNNGDPKKALDKAVKDSNEALSKY